MNVAPVKLQDFAKQNGVTDRAIQKHLKKHENELQGHFWRKGPNGTWLDEFAQVYIKNLMREQPIVVFEHDEKMEMLEEQNKMLLEALNEAKDRIIVLQEQNSELAIKNEKIALLEADNESKDKLLAEERIASQKLSDELSGANKRLEDENHLLKNELEAEKNRKLTFAERLFGKKRKAKSDLPDNKE